MGKHHSKEALEAKMLDYKVRITSRIAGVNKNKFFTDCINKRLSENILMLKIIDIHYSIINEVPELKHKEFTELKKILIERIKLK